MALIHDRIRLACKIHTAYQQAASRSALEQQAHWRHFADRFELAKEQRQLVEKARQHGWHLAAHQQQVQFCALLRTLAESLSGMQERMLLRASPVPLFKDLLDELQNLDTEF